MKRGLIAVDASHAIGTVSIGLGNDSRLDVNVHHVKGDTHRLVVTQFRAGTWAQLCVREFDSEQPAQGGSDYETLKAADVLADALATTLDGWTPTSAFDEAAANALAAYQEARHGQQ